MARSKLCSLSWLRKFLLVITAYTVIFVCFPSNSSIDDASLQVDDVVDDVNGSWVILLKQRFFIPKKDVWKLSPALARMCQTQIAVS